MIHIMPVTIMNFVSPNYPNQILLSLNLKSYKNLAVKILNFSIYSRRVDHLHISICPPNWCLWKAENSTVTVGLTWIIEMSSHISRLKKNLMYYCFVWIIEKTMKLYLYLLWFSNGWTKAVKDEPKKLLYEFLVGKL